ncbi:cation diffusion facilitator family transporter [Aliicoccus persicus]|uniref:Cation diffusion facilitator family transporter n=2 Tax=Aliicoccus persicus TaxID=930138 RepID=A0A662Z3S9_9STAP|nr:cation diffusion facilitator family transporter [Aliicoccus persicus]
MSNRAKQAMFATTLGVVVNIVLTIIKLWGGIVGNSRALIADAVHSASDVISSFVVLFGVRAANKPPDDDHPYGHGKYESVAALIVAILLIVIGIEILVSSVQLIFANEAPQVPKVIALVIIVISIVVKEGLYQYKIRLGRRIKSDALIADAWHHRSDSISSIVALIGVGIAMIGGQFGIPYLHFFDVIAGAFIAAIIMYVGYGLAKDSVRLSAELILDKEESMKFYETVEAIDGVIQIDSLYARTHGSYLVIDMKIGVKKTLTVEEGHDIAEFVRSELMRKYEEVSEVFVHVNPY